MEVAQGDSVQMSKPAILVKSQLRPAPVLESRLLTQG